jgi:hypothetical protein
VPKYAQTAIALILLLFSNILVLFGLDISPAKEAALTTILNTAALLGFLVYGIVHTHELHADKRAGHVDSGV